ncbi:MAG TPA: diacylglycerol kinase family lipid kinase [Caldithrix abyssi]|uniref:Diacylglycerol kinase family lipid kinase n=1 Tax=Caldithrix abyssi TaxID=187145 RepID=A0A7V4U0G6_CALAY|nr:diacylglycerol kinase family lipid kinase [Caldithrix abyssi]
MKLSFMQTLFVINPVSGIRKNLEQITGLIRRKYDAAGRGYRIEYTRYAGHATELAKSAAREGVDIVVAVGGDGTMNEVARGLVHSDSALGIIPGGSGNGFARSLNIPLHPEKAIDLLLSANQKRIDAGMINEHYFFGVCGLGFDAEIGARFQNFGRRGPLPYFYIGVKEYFGYRPERVRFTAENLDVQKDIFLITVANTQQYGNGAYIAPQADEQDGFLDVCIVEPFTLPQILANLHRLFNKTVDKFSAYSSFRCKEITIIRQKEQGWFHTDGEPRQGGKELKIKVVPGCLKVCHGNK